MSQKRVILIVAYEGIDDWVDLMLRRGWRASHGWSWRLRTLFSPKGTVRELKVIELEPDEKLVGLDALRAEKR